MFPVTFWEELICQLAGGGNDTVALFTSVFEPLFIFSEAALASLSVDPAVMLMVVGVLMFVITFCGCVGSLRENICLLQTVSKSGVFQPGQASVYSDEMIFGS